MTGPRIEVARATDPARWRMSVTRVLLAAAASALLASAGAGAERDQAADAVATYRQVLDAWANGERPPAVRDLAALELRWTAELGELQDFQVKVLRRLVKKDHRSLVAAARLHQEVFRLHGETPLMGPKAAFDLQAHAMTMNDHAVRLSLRYTEKYPEIRRHAAVLLTSMAALLREQRYVAAAAERLHRATELDPRLAVAFEWGGSAEEQLSRLAGAARLLRRLIELEPENYRGRLRLAMVESKRGDERARGLLEGIVDSDHRSWVWIFAAEELAQDYARAGRLDDAVALLRRALAEYPDEQGLSVALAFHDRGPRGRSRASLEALESRSAPASARVAYSGWERREAFDAMVESTLR